MVVHRHTAEMCPAGKVRPDKEFSNKLKEQISKAGVKLVEGYDTPGHEMYIIIEAGNSSISLWPSFWKNWKR